MKKGLFFLGIAALTLASCSQEDVIDVNRTAVNGNSIAFRARTGKATRALEYDSYNLDDFMVYGYKGCIDDEDDTMIPYFLNGNPLLFKRDGLLYTSSTPYYYPADGSWLTFLAYAPSSLVMEKSGDHGGIKNNFTVNSDITKQIDLIFANGGSNLMPDEEDQELTFEHALTKVFISELRNNDTRFKYEIAGIKFGNIYNTAEVEYFGELWQKQTADDQNEVWNEEGKFISHSGGDIFCHPQGDQTDEMVLYFTPKVLDKDATTVSLMSGDDRAAIAGAEGAGSEAFMLIPQQLSKDKLTDSGDGIKGSFGAGMSYIALLVRITNTITNEVIYPYSEGVDNISETIDGVTYAWAAFPVASLWVPGLYMDYMIDLSEGAGFVAPGAEGRDLEETDDDNNVITTHIDLEYTPILGRVIKFYESVFDWDQGGAVTVTEKNVLQVDNGDFEDPFGDDSGDDDND